KYLAIHPIGLIVPTPALVFDQYNGVIPDLVFFSHGRRSEIVEGERLIAAPELAIEILSAGSQNINRDRITKRQLYSKYSMKEYWSVDVENRAVEIYRRSPTGLALAATLYCGEHITSPLLPNFDCSVDSLFEE